MEARLDRIDLRADLLARQTEGRSTDEARIGPRLQRRHLLRRENPASIAKEAALEGTPAARGGAAGGGPPKSGRGSSTTNSSNEAISSRGPARRVSETQHETAQL